jgi:hypothetical protein
MSTYPWKRFWCPREGAFSLADDGFVADPEATDWLSLNPDLRSFDEIADVPCLALLGEPGIGKSTALQEAVDATEAAAVSSGDFVLSINLAGVGSDAGLYRRIFDDPAFRTWDAASAHLHLFFDSLDEALLESGSIATVLLDELKRCDRDRLSLRIACRTAEWPERLDQGLPLLFGHDNFAALELVPLRRRDVEEAAQIEELDSEAFVRELLLREVVPLTIKPVTLGFLFNLYREGGTFPRKQSELYRQGCFLLAGERDRDRRERERAGDLSGAERLAIAERVAAVSMFAARDSVWLVPDRGDKPDTAVTLAELAGGVEDVDADVAAASSTIEVSEASLRETLRTGLFSGRGSNALGFAHQTYAEFLAARYLLNHRMPVSEVMNLLSAHGDSAGRLVPQLHEVAGWLATLEPSIFAAILECDPEVLLRSDVRIASEDERERLVEEVLLLAREQRLPASGRGNFGKLAHPRLVEQLRPIVTDRAADRLVRRTAVDVAEECSLAELADDLIAIAGDATEAYTTRVDAAWAVTRLGDDAAKEQLRPFLSITPDQDPDDELKGCALRALWPQALTLDESLAAMTPPQRPELIGGYSMFLSHDLVSEIESRDLARALEWAREQPHQQRLHRFDELIDQLISRAFDHLRDHRTAEALARTAAGFIKRDHRLFVGASSEELRRKIIDAPERRHLLLDYLLPHIVAGEVSASDLAFAQENLAVPDDIPFFVSRLDKATEESQRQSWASLIDSVFYLNSPHMEVVLEARDRHPELRVRLAPWLDPIELDSPRAEELRERHQKTRELEEQRNEREQLDPPLSERIDGLLARIEAGETDAWWPLTVELSRDEHAPGLVNHFKSDLRTSPAWRDGDADIRERILVAAVSYLETGKPMTDDWFGQQKINNGAIAGFRALRLLADEQPSALERVSARLWERWAGTIIAFPTSGETGDHAAQTRLVARAYEYAAEEVLSRVELLIEADARADRHPFVLNRVAALPGEGINEIAARKAEDTSLPHERRAELLQFLLDRGSRRGAEIAERILGVPPPAEGGARQFAIRVAALLLARTADGFAHAWTLIQSDREFGRSVIAAVAADEDRFEGRVGRLLTEEQLGDLFAWMEREYPHAEDRVFTGAHFVGEREMIERWRDSLLQQLETRGTEQACRVLRRLDSEFSELDWIKAIRARAEENQRRQSWVPPSPSELVALAARPELRFVESGEQLLRVIRESLERAQEELQGETPAVRDLWNDLGLRDNVRYYTPKSENELSDWLARFMRRDLAGRGIVVNREVEISRPAGAGLGERTDVHVTAFSKDPERPSLIRAVVEVKGCWHRELGTALETQLVARYLRGTDNRYGLYVAGWFTSDHWEPSDWRRGACGAVTKDAAAALLAEQAEHTTHDDNLVVGSMILDLTLR